jgi:hypothetical protein
MNKFDSQVIEIREYTNINKELQQSHHFLYNLALDKNNSEAEILIMGINPGEAPEDWVNHPDISEETHLYDFHEHSLNGRSNGSIKWRNFSKFFSCEKPVVFSELFFWSSRSLQELNNRYGDWLNSDHINFCKNKNNFLLGSGPIKGIPNGRMI